MKSKMDLVTAKYYAQNLITELRTSCHKIEIAGSIRREKSVVGDIEIVLIPKFESKSHKRGLDKYLKLSSVKCVNLLEENLRLMQNTFSFRFGKNGSKYKELIIFHFR